MALTISGIDLFKLSIPLKRPFAIADLYALKGIASPQYSPDGKYLFFQRKVGGNTDIYWVDARVLEALRPKELR